MKERERALSPSSSLAKPKDCAEDGEASPDHEVIQTA